MTKHLWTIGKYAIGFALLGTVIWWNWEPTNRSQIAVLGTSTVGLMGSPMGQGPMLAATAAVPGRANGSPGLKAALQGDLRWLPLLAGAAICTVSLLLTFIRWYVLVRAQDLPFRVSEALRLGMIGYALSTFLPGSIGGDIIKAACLARSQNRRTVAVATVVFDRIIGLWALFLLAGSVGLVFWLAGAVHGTALKTIIGASWLCIGLSLIGWLVLGFVPQAAMHGLAHWLERVPKLGPMLAELSRTVWMYRCRGHHIWLAVLMAVVGHVGFVLTFYFAGLTLSAADAIPSLRDHFLIVPVGMTIQAGFPAPGGVGGGELAFGYLYELVGYAFAAGVLASLIQRVITWGLGLIGYITYLRMRPSLPKEPATLAEPSLAGAEL